MKKLEFWFEFASTYSYLSAMRLPALAKERGVTVDWKPFLLGPIFREQGMDTSPFNIFPIKGAYMWRDVTRRADALRLPFEKPDPFPQNGLLAARMATAALADNAAERFTQCVYLAEFGQGLDISQPDVIAQCAEKAGLSERVQTRARSTEVKDQLRDATQTASVKGIFGAPTFIVGDELFWGDDRLEDALDWAVAHA